MDPTITMGIDFWNNARKTPYYEIVLHNLLSANFGAPIHDLRVRTGYYKNRSIGKNKLTLSLLPIGSKRREFVKKICKSLKIK